MSAPDTTTNLLALRRELEQVYNNDVVFKQYVDAQCAKLAQHPSAVIYDLLRSGFAPLVIAMAAATFNAQQATIKALQTQRIEMAVPADYAKSERAPDWLREMIINIKGDIEGQ